MHVVGNTGIEQEQTVEYNGAIKLVYADRGDGSEEHKSKSEPIFLYVRHQQAERMLPLIVSNALYEATAADCISQDHAVAGLILKRLNRVGVHSNYAVGIGVTEPTGDGVVLEVTLSKREAEQYIDLSFIENNIRNLLFNGTYEEFRAHMNRQEVASRRVVDAPCFL